MKKSILLVEDDETLYSAMQSKLVNADYDVTLATTGSEALNISKQKKFDLILLDIVIPSPNGFEVLKLIRLNNDYENTPIIITSNLGQDSEIHTGLNLGASDYLIKANIDLDTLLEIIAKHIPRR